MKLQKIVAKELKMSRFLPHSHQTDLFYIRFANQLQEHLAIVDREFMNEEEKELLHQLSIMLTCYFEDIMADSGIWRTFSNLCQKMYGYPVPIYHDREVYYPDEPSLNAVKFLTWLVITDVRNHVVFAESHSLLSLANEAYHLMNETFEDAPVNDELNDQIDEALNYSIQGFFPLREVLHWLFSGCYILQSEKSRSIIFNNFEDAIKTESFEEEGMALHYATYYTIFNYKVGPLALYSYEWLAALMHTKGMEKEAAEVEKIEKVKRGYFKYEFKDDNILHLTRTCGTEIDVATDEINTNEIVLQFHNGCMASGFIRYQNKWYLNGFVMLIDNIEKHWQDFCKNDVDYQLANNMSLTAETILKRTDGQRLFYFKDKNELKNFLHETIKFPDHLLGFVDEQIGEKPVVFVDVDDLINPLQIFYGYAPCIHDLVNPYYDSVDAEEDTTRMLWDAECLTTHAVKYLLDHGFLPNVYKVDIFCESNTPEQKRADIDFLLRCWRKENY